jgi:hypothetical protein
MSPALALRACLLALGCACRRDIEPDEPPQFRARLVDAAVDPGEPSPPLVEVEVKARVVDAKADKAAGTTIVTVGVGVNHGVRLDWIGAVVDETGGVVGTFTVIEVKPRTTIGASPLTPKQLEGKLVRLASPPPPAPP